MKQGTGNSQRGDMKVEPKSRAVDVGYAGGLGIQEVCARAEPMYEGRGFQAPKPVATTVHKTGSQRG
jgi:hypothetical protein